MDRYQIIVLGVAALFLLIILVAVGMMMPRQDAEAPWPPVAGRCPDGWMEDATVKNKCAVPINNNKGQIVGGSADAKRVDSSTSTLTALYPNKFRDVRGGDWLTINQIQYMVERVDRNERTLTLKNFPNSGNVTYERSIFAFEGRTVCDKKKWANKWGVRWDGVSNYNKCP
jgi:hypothetical protein